MKKEINPLQEISKVDKSNKVLKFDLQGNINLEKKYYNPNEYKLNKLNEKHSENIFKKN